MADRDLVRHPATGDADAGQASSAPSTPPPDRDAAKAPGEVLAALYAQRRAKAAEAPSRKDPREALAELAAQRGSVAEEPVARDPRQLLSDLAARHSEGDGRATAPSDAPTARLQAPPAPMHQPDSPPPGQDEVDRLRAELDRQNRRLAELERLLVERTSERQAQRGAASPPSIPGSDAAPPTAPALPSPEGRTLSARLRARQRALGELPTVAPPPAAPSPEGPPPDAPPPPIPVADPALSSPERGALEASESPSRDSDRPGGSHWRRWLLVLPLLALLILVLQAVMLLRSHDLPSAPAARRGQATTAAVGAEFAPTAVPTAAVAIQGSTASVPITPPPTVPISAVSAAARVVILPSTPAAVPTAAPSPAPTATASPLPTATASAVPTIAPALALLARVAAAENAVRSGQLTATIDDGKGTHATATLVFDLGNGTQPPRMHFTTTYTSPAGTQSSEQITIGDRAWQRQPNGQWAPATPHGVWDNLHSYLPHASTVTGAVLAGNGSTLTWFDANSAADMTLSVDAASGVPLTLQEAPRAGGPRRTITYSAWNVPVEINAPPGT